jgi:hypothetical protein
MPLANRTCANDEYAVLFRHSVVSCPPSLVVDRPSLKG